MRLTREQPWKSQIGCSAAVALLVAAPGLFIGTMTYFHDHSDNRNKIFAFAAVWVLVGVMILLSAIHQAFAMRSPETLLEIDSPEFAPGDSVHIRVIQPGPLRLQSIHANLAGEDTTITLSRRDPGRKVRNTRYLGPFRMIEIDRYDIAGGEQLEREATFQVPPDIAPSLESPDRTVRWKIEVWGRVAMWPDFMHPFPVVVTHSAAGASGSAPASRF